MSDVNTSDGETDVNVWGDGVGRIVGTAARKKSTRIQG